jgi:hypothetical protein
VKVSTWPDPILRSARLRRDMVHILCIYICMRQRTKKGTYYIFFLLLAITVLMSVLCNGTRRGKEHLQGGTLDEDRYCI